MAGFSISVAMCTFNGTRYLPAQLESIAGQTRPPDEVIICDDRSPDNTKELIDTFAGHSCLPIQFSVNEQTLGSTQNFERAIAKCRGRIVALADQDDIWYAHKLEKIEQAFRESDKIVAAFSDADLIDANSGPLHRRLWSSVSFNRAEQLNFANEKALDVLIKHPVVTGATMAFRKDLFELFTPIPEDEIHDRWISFLLAAHGPIRPIPEPLVQYRRHEQQQIGPGPLDFQSTMRQARDRGAQFYADEIIRYSR
jgi:glycosyltransferase involved in cell wall biosynthesis